MAYTSSTFIFLVLSGLLVAAYLPLRLRIYWMIALSLGWFATWNVYFPLVIVPLIFTHHICGIKKQVWPAVFVTLSAFVLFRTLESSLAVGCSFYLLILLGYTIDVSNRKSEILNWNESLLMGTFFPLMMSGPVVRSNSFASSLRESRMSWESLTDGCLVFSVGFLKFIFFSEVFTVLSGYWRYNEGWTAILASSFFATLRLYLSLSSFADMGRGIARAFGIIVTPSFVPIFFAKDPSDFWERWNRTVAGWFRDYLVIPSLLKWGRKIPAQFILLFAFVILGIWHGFEIQWIIFGVFNGLMVILGSALRKRLGDHFLGRILVLLLILGNGLIQIGRDILERNQTRFISPEIDTFFYVALILFFILEWMQEKKGENDFFLHWKPGYKKAIAITLFLLWIFLADHREPLNPETLPLYFDL